MEKRHKFSLWYVLIGIWVVLIVQSYISSMFVVESIPYSSFLDLLKEGKVTEIAVSENEIQGKMITQEGKEQKFKSIRVDPELSEMLQNYQVTFKGEIEVNYAQNVLSWVLPIVLLVAIWYFVIRRMSGNQPGFMSIGKNKAKIYMENELNIRFDDVAAWTRQNRSWWRSSIS